MQYADMVNYSLFQGFAGLLIRLLEFLAALFRVQLLCQGTV